MTQVYTIAISVGGKPIGDAKYVLLSDYNQIEDKLRAEEKAHKYTKAERDAAIAGVPLKRVPYNPYHVLQPGEIMAEWDGETL